jgi:hypothetical protein
MTTARTNDDGRHHEVDAEGEGSVHEVVIRFSGLEIQRLRELAAPEGATVEEYIRACVLGPRAPGPVELLAEIIRRRMGRTR